MSRTRFVSALLVAILSIVARALVARANPRPEPVVPAPDSVLHVLLDSNAPAEARQQAGRDLTRELAKSAQRIFYGEVRDLIDRNLDIVEPYLIESQRLAKDPCLLLLRDFRVLSDSIGRARMCAALRIRVVFPRALHRGRAPVATADGYRPAMQLIPVVNYAEALSDFRDRNSIPAIRAVLDSLDGYSYTAAEWGFYEGASIGSRDTPTTPSWRSRDMGCWSRPTPARVGHGDSPSKLQSNWRRRVTSRTTAELGRSPFRRSDCSGSCI